MKIKKEYVEAMGGSKKPQDGPRQESKRKFDIRLVQGYINEIDRYYGDKYSRARGLEDRHWEEIKEKNHPEFRKAMEIYKGESGRVQTGSPDPELGVGPWSDTLHKYGLGKYLK